MKYKRGLEVEVFCKRALPSGAWLCAEIISGNGHAYRIKYDQSLYGVNAPVERVPRKAIRPCPPLIQGPWNWVFGDIVEVSDDNSWKVAEVSSVVGENYIVVRLLGSSRVIKVHESDLRVRQSWQDNRWVVIGKDARNSDDGELLKEGFLQNLSCQRSQPVLKLRIRVNKTADQVPNMVFPGSRRRGSQFCSSPVDTCQRVAKKLRPGEKEGRREQLAAGNSYRLQEKVDAVASPRMMLGEKYMHSSLNSRTGLSEMGMERGKLNGDMGCLFARSLEPDDTSLVCSSCGSNDPDMPNHHLSTGPSLDRDTLSDDAESSCRQEPLENQTNLSKDLTEEIRKLELHAYHTTMVALYASGPLSWEQEALISNLRLALHISNDEHRSELRHLASEFFFR